MFGSNNETIEEKIEESKDEDSIVDELKDVSNSKYSIYVKFY